MARQLINHVLRRLPGFFRFNGLRDYLYDYRRFTRYSSALDPKISPQARLARITKAYHMIEKGLALPEPRPGFGQEPIAMLLAEVPELEAAGHAGPVTRSARASLAAYVRWHDALGHQVPPPVRQFAATAETAPGGAIVLERQFIQSAAGIDFARFARSRYSVRNFTGAPVSEEAIRTAVEVALKTPRVCNRETRRVHFANTPGDMGRMLSVQNGNRGFGHLAGAVLMITSDVREFVEYGERNQCWVDGGLFAMTLAFAFHAQGLGTCMLNASNASWKDRRLRAILGLPDHEVVITFMAVGHLPDQLMVAESPAPDVDSILRRMG